MAALFSFHDYGDQAERARGLIEAFQQGRHLVVLASPDQTPQKTAQYLIEQRVSVNTKAVVCSNLTLPDQQVIREPLKRVAHWQFPWLTVSIVLNPDVHTEAEDRRQWLRWRRTHECQ